MSDRTDLAALGVSVVAAGIALWSARKSAHNAVRLVEIEEGRDRAQKKASKLAHVRVTMVRERLPNGSTRGTLTLHNDGPAAAENVILHASTAGMLDEMSLIFKDVQPVERMAPDQSVEFSLFTYDGMPEQFRLTATPRNPGGLPDQRASVVGLASP